MEAARHGGGCVSIFKDVRVLLSALITALMVTGVGLADTTGGIRGYVYDPYGGATVAGAHVILTSAAATVETTTNHAGFFAVLDLPPGLLWSLRRARGV